MSSGINKHFKREAIIMVGFFLSFGVLAMIAGFFGPKIMYYLEVKKCRQSGGIYSSEKQECVISNRKTSETIK
ncbi:MAG: hypothetical protein IPN42_16565 [Methylococcaceae bacterium]|nr:hypothetical protein [Methylococcaceae bacterium]